MSQTAQVRFAAKNLSELQVLRLVQQYRALTRAQICDITGWNQTKVVRLVSDLISQSLLSSSDQAAHPSRPGRPSELIEINPHAGHAVGLEFGRKHLRGVVVDAVGSLTYSFEDVPAIPFEGCDSTMDQIVAVLNQLVKDSHLSWSDVFGVGIALHDIVSADGEWLTHENLYSSPYDVRGFLGRELSRLVVVEDISRAFAEMEHRFGASKDLSDMIYLFLGSHGVGSGVFINNQMLKSSSGVCGEIGHIVVDERGGLCTCGNVGCFEVVASQDAIIGQFDELVAQGVQTSFTSNGTTTFEQICLMAARGDKAAYLVLHNLAANMGKALSSAVNITGAPNIVIGGELRLAGGAFLADVTSVLRRNVIGVLAKDVSVQYASLPNYAGAWGVATQALEAAWTEGRFLPVES